MSIIEKPLTCCCLALFLPWWTAALAASAQEAIVYNFAPVGPTGLGGPATPHSGPIFGSDGNLYGTTDQGGRNDNGPASQGGDGTIYRLTPGGSATVLHSFGDNATDGRNPDAPLLLASDGNFYGVTTYGGANGNDGSPFSGDGTVFRVSPSGSYSVLYSFGSIPGDAINPEFALVESPSTGELFGVTATGGANDGGAVFKISKAGSYSLLYSFGNGNFSSGGTNPSGALVFGADGDLYGLTRKGGVNGDGVLYRITPSGDESVVYWFGACFTDAGSPGGSLALGNDGNFYGTSEFGGEDGSKGTVFVVTPDGRSRVIHSFAPASGGPAFANQGLARAGDGNFYGVLSAGGAHDAGALYVVGPDGSFSTLYDFADSSSDGQFPIGLVMPAGPGRLYGVTGVGGSAGTGTLYQVTASGVAPAAYPSEIVDGCKAEASREQGGGSFDFTCLLVLLITASVRNRHPSPLIR